MATQVPNDYTECETYRGHVIAMRGGGSYAAFRGHGGLPRTAWVWTRADCRRAIDAHILDTAAHASATGHW